MRVFINVMNIIIPVEIQHREMMAKLYLGAVAVARGHNVIVGDQREIAKRVFELEPGVYIDKSCAKTKRSLFRKLRKCGYIPVTLCEEGLVYRDKARYIRERIDPEALREAHALCCWGSKQENDILSVLPNTETLKVTGNPRFDLLRPEFRQIWEEESAQVLTETGRFILVNTNFSRFNRLPGTADVIELLKKRGTLDVDGPAYYRGLVDRLSILMQAFLDVIPEISANFPEHTIIVRPHPGEYVSPYLSLQERCSRLRVVNGGSVIPWLLAADAIVHNSCTTGVEGWVLDRPVISYAPEGGSQYDSWLPTELSYQCSSAHELIGKLDEVITAGASAKRDEYTEKIALDYIHGLSGNMAAEQLIDQLPATVGSARALPRAFERVMGKARVLARTIPGLRVSAGHSLLASQKFPGVDVGEVRRFLNNVASCRPELGCVNVYKMAGWNNVFRLTVGDEVAAVDV